jgi:hypothetical protein
VYAETGLLGVDDSLQKKKLDKENLMNVGTYLPVSYDGKIQGRLDISKAVRLEGFTFILDD